MLYIITVLMILSLSLVLNNKFKIKLNYSFLISSLSFAIILYLFGLFKGLEIGVYFILIISLICFLYKTRFYPLELYRASTQEKHFRFLKFDSYF